MTPLQCRAARALIGWTQLDLADAASVSTDTIRNFELEARNPRPASVQQMDIAFAAAAVTFIDENGGGSGVMMFGATSPSQIRAARALLGWSHADLARQCDFSSRLTRYTLGQSYRARTEGAVGRRETTMIVALGRKLLIALWRMATIGEIPVGVTLRTAVA